PRGQHDALKNSKSLHPHSSRARQENFCPLDKDLSWRSAISNEVGPLQGIFSQVLASSGHTRPLGYKSVVRWRFACSPDALLSVSLHRFDAGHQPSLRSQRTMMTYANSLPRREAVA